MHAAGLMAQRAARLPAGPSNPDCHAGMSFTTLRDAAPLPPGRAARNVLHRTHRSSSPKPAPRCAIPVISACGLQRSTSVRCRGRRLAVSSLQRRQPERSRHRQMRGRDAASASRRPSAPPSTTVDGVERVRGQHLELMFEARRCIHSRFCVTGAPQYFSPTCRDLDPPGRDAGGARRRSRARVPVGRDPLSPHRRRDDENAPPVNLIGVREAGPYAFRGQLQIDGEARAFAPRSVAAALRRTSRSATARTARSGLPHPASRRAARPTCCRARRCPGDRSRRRTVRSGARQPRDHQRHGSCGRARRFPRSSVVAAAARRNHSATARTRASDFAQTSSSSSRSILTATTAVLASDHGRVFTSRMSSSTDRSESASRRTRTGTSIRARSRRPTWRCTACCRISAISVLHST